MKKWLPLRRYMHQHPELSFQEYNTAKFIQAFYEKLQIEVKGNVGGNGVVARFTEKNLVKQLHYGLILMHYPSRMKRKFHINH